MCNFVFVLNWAGVAQIPVGTRSVQSNFTSNTSADLIGKRLLSDTKVKTSNSLVGNVFIIRIKKLYLFNTCGYL